MAYVLVVADESFPVVRSSDRLTLSHNRRWAEQVAAAQPDVEAHVVQFPRGQPAEAVWPTLMSAYRVAARRAGTNGVLGILMGHGGGGNRLFVDLAPPEHLRIFEDDLETNLAARRAGTGPTEVRQQRVVSLRSTLTAYMSRVDLYACNIGSGRMAPLPDRLRAVWDQPVRAFRDGWLRRHRRAATPP